MAPRKYLGFMVEVGTEASWPADPTDSRSNRLDAGAGAIGHSERWPSFIPCMSGEKDGRARLVQDAGG